MPSLIFPWRLSQFLQIIIVFGNYPNKISENFLAPNASGELTTESETKTDVQKETEVTEPQNFVPGLILPPSATGDTVTFWR